MKTAAYIHSLSSSTVKSLMPMLFAFALISGCANEVGVGHHQAELAASNDAPSLSRRRAVQTLSPMVQNTTPERIGHGWSMPQHPVPQDGVSASASATGLGGPWSEEDEELWADGRLAHATATVGAVEQDESSPGAELEWFREETSSHNSTWASVFGSPTSYLFAYSGYAVHGMALEADPQDCPIGNICTSYGIIGAGNSGLFVGQDDEIDPIGGGTGVSSTGDADEHNTTGVTLTVRTAMRFELSTALEVIGSSASGGGVLNSFLHHGMVSVQVLDEDGGFVTAIDGGTVALQSSITVRDDMPMGQLAETVTFDLQPGEYTFLIGVSDRASTLGEISETPGQNTLSYLFEGNVDAEVQLRAIGRAEG